MTGRATATLIAWLGLLACETPSTGPGTNPSASAASTVSAQPTASAQPTSSAQPTASVSSEDRATLTFSIEGEPLRDLERGELLARIDPVTFTAFDPYYRRPKTFRALPLRAVLEIGFQGRDLALEAQHYVLRAKDGYTVPIDGKRLLEEGGHLAIDDVDTPDGWEPLGRRQVDPGPYYLVWEQEEQQDLDSHPRPYMLQGIEISSFERTFPRTVPTGLSDGHPARHGFRIFREQCLRCHAINQQGGKVGPELNVPQSIVEYRPEAQIRAYIRKPTTFRYGNMPDNPHLTDEDLDGLIAYFQAMSERKQDATAGAGVEKGH